jgi:hypothetical protein
MQAFNEQSRSLQVSESEERVLKTQLANLQLCFEELEKKVNEVTEQREREVNKLLETMNTVKKITSRFLNGDKHASNGNGVHHSQEELSAEIVAFLREWDRKNRVGCPLPDLYRQLQVMDPQLSIGRFHDALRTLYQAKKIQLINLNDSPDHVKQPELLLFISSKAIYYARIT